MSSPSLFLLSAAAGDVVGAAAEEHRASGVARGVAAYFGGAGEAFVTANCDSSSLSCTKHCSFSSCLKASFLVASAIALGDSRESSCLSFSNFSCLARRISARRMSFSESIASDIVAFAVTKSTERRVVNSASHFRSESAAPDEVETMQTLTDLQACKSQNSRSLAESTSPRLECSSS